MTPRRWLAWCNPGLAALITETLGTDAWVNETTLLAGLRAHADDKGFQAKWRKVKHDNKDRLAAKIKARGALVHAAVLPVWSHAAAMSRAGCCLVVRWVRRLRMLLWY